MTDESTSSNSGGVSLKTPWGTLGITGRDVILTILLVAIAALIYYEGEQIKTQISTVQTDRVRQLDNLQGIIQQIFQMDYSNYDYQNKLLRAICRNESPLQQQGQCEPSYKGFPEPAK